MESLIKEILVQNGIKIFEKKDFEFLGKLGEGAEGKVYRAKYENKPIALKIIENFDIKLFGHEIAILSSINHESFPKFYGVMLDSNEIGLVLEQIIGYTLEELILKSKKDKIKLTNDHKFKIIQSVAISINYLHQNKFVHRDLKPANLMIEAKTKKVFLIDFGIAKILFGDGEPTRVKGTLPFLAPENLDLEISDGIKDTNEIFNIVTTKQDVWSFGCFVSYLYSGIKPWFNLSQYESVIQDLLQKKHPFPIPDNITDENIRKIIELCTEVEVHKRCEIGELKALLNILDEM